MKFLRPAIAGLFISAIAAFPAAAQSPVVGPPWQRTAHNNSTITAGGIAQTLNSLWTFVQSNGYEQPNTIRCVQNPGSASEDLFVSLDSTASSTHGFDLVPGVGMCYFFSGTMSVNATTTGHAFLVTELGW